MHALIDADRICYAFGGFVDDEGYPLGWPLVAERVDSNIQGLLSATGSSESTLFITADDSSNFRIGIATIVKYKGHRSAGKPFWYEQIRRYLVDKYKAVVVHGMEADDAIGIAASNRIRSSSNMELENACTIVSVDKDLDMIPGYHYNELHPEKGVYWIDELTSLKAFYTQLLTGDPTDNIPGLYGVGKSSAMVRRIRDSSDELSMYNVVQLEYEKRFGSYWEQFLMENARLLWILRMDDVDEVVYRLNKLNLEAASKTESVNN